MTADEQKRHANARHAFIPAGVLIGLGVGLLAGYPGPGVLIGLGLGFLATAFFPPTGAAGPDAPTEKTRGGTRPILAFIGIFMIVIGIGIAVAPQALWLYVIPVLLILIGIGFVLRGIRSST